MTGERLEVIDPGESEDIGRDWADPAALTEYGEREPTGPWAWAGPQRAVTGHTWDGCIEVIQVLVARPPVSSFASRPTQAQRNAHRTRQHDIAIEVIGRYNPDAMVCLGVPFGHTRPQWLLPYGGHVTVDGATHKVWADFR